MLVESQRKPRRAPPHSMYAQSDREWDLTGLSMKARSHKYKNALNKEGGGAGIDDIVQRCIEAVNQRSSTQSQRQTILNLNKSFRAANVDDAKHLTAQELRQGMQASGAVISMMQAVALLGWLDRDGRGTVSLEEFKRMLLDPGEQEAIRAESDKMAFVQSQRPGGARGSNNSDIRSRDAGHGHGHGRGRETSTRTEQFSAAGTLEEIRGQLMEGGIRAMVGLQKYLNLVDSDNSGRLTRHELGVAFREAGVTLNDRQVFNIFGRLDRDHTGTVEKKDVLRAVHGKISKRRTAVVDAAFYGLDKRAGMGGLLPQV